jgi:hypothetical protein
MPLNSWDEVIPALDMWVGPCMEAAAKIRVPALGLPTEGHIGFYYSPETEKYAIYAHKDATENDAEKTIKFAKEIGNTRSVPLTLDDLDQQPWVKVAYSQTLKTIAENLNFIPGKYLGMIPNNPNPLAAMLTSGLVGAGLGYGAGRLAKAVAPKGWGENLPTSLALLGGGLGAGTAGLVRGYPSLAEGKSLLSNWPFSDTGEPIGEEAPTGRSELNITNIPQKLQEASGEFTPLAPKPAPMRYKRGFDTFAPDLPMPAAPTPFDVNVNALGQTLWQTGASPQLTAGTMATMYAASQMPSERQIPGYVMADQLGKLALNAAGDYSKGFLAGYAINKVVGTPFTASQYGMGNAGLGILGAVVPKIFGQ